MLSSQTVLADVFPATCCCCTEGQGMLAAFIHFVSLYHTYMYHTYSSRLDTAAAFFKIIVWLTLRQCTNNILFFVTAKYSSVCCLLLLIGALLSGYLDCAYLCSFIGCFFSIHLFLLLHFCILTLIWSVWSHSFIEKQSQLPAWFDW